MVNGRFSCLATDLGYTRALTFDVHFFRKFRRFTFASPMLSFSPLFDEGTPTRYALKKAAPAQAGSRSKSSPSEVIRPIQLRRKGRLRRSSLRTATPQRVLKAKALSDNQLRWPFAVTMG